MWLIVLEAVGALALFLFLMWWTMFSGRSKGEMSEVSEAAAENSKDDAAAGAPKPPADAPGP
ncbi:MAG: hypothetical protein PSV38_20315 [Aquabacterium sp.]|nr:hypothetical protein [Aquabacterium sp.]MDI1261609.1 hypothetical protein [Aquabacterium sp.]